ncbi:hypothetical protein CEXT_150391 [Caerostris extrusa]|uniref:Uncharacterized protein n=1 Tax=Caerostris extrusa TaxID=172846 RepID=A0AAV4XEY3_CAEEX|nr:hypothetical protein CEXT_150391 [Caerostris extrusa]
MHSGCVINSKILIDKFEYEDDFVVPHSNLSPVFDIILGLNFLNKYEFIIDCKNNSLRNETTSINWNFKRSFYNVFGHIDGKINDKCRKKLNTSVQNEINKKIRVADDATSRTHVEAHPGCTQKKKKTGQFGGGLKEDPIEFVVSLSLPPPKTRGKRPVWNRALAW